MFHRFVYHNGCMLFFPQWKISFIYQLCKCSYSDLGQPVIYYNQVPPLVPLFQSKLGNVFFVAPSFEIDSRIPNKTRKYSTTLAATLLVVSSSGLTGVMINFAPFCPPYKTLVHYNGMISPCMEKTINWVQSIWYFSIFVAHVEKSLQSGSPLDGIEMYHHCKKISTSVAFEWNRMP